MTHLSSPSGPPIRTNVAKGTEVPVCANDSGPAARAEVTSALTVRPEGTAVGPVAHTGTVSTQTAPTVTPTRSGRGEARTPSSATAPGLADLPGWVVLAVVGVWLGIVVAVAWVK